MQAPATAGNDSSRVSTWIPIVWGAVPDVAWRDADGTLRVLRRHRLAGVVANLINSGGLNPPDPIRMQILDLAGQWKTRCASYDLEIGRLLHQAGGLARPILLKGASVAERYATPADRLYRDLDLLIPAADVEAWDALLVHNGYARQGEW